jgi:hypothetical protein
MNDDKQWRKKHGNHHADHRAAADGEDGSDSGDASQGGGGQAGTIAYTDFLASNENIRDDFLSNDDKKRLLSVHDQETLAHIKKQKAILDKYHDLKAGKINLAEYRQGMAYGSGGGQMIPRHPILYGKFAGIADPNMNPNPADNYDQAQANPENRLQLQEKLQLKNAPQAAPRFNPKPRPQ